MIKNNINLRCCSPHAILFFTQRFELKKIIKSLVKSSNISVPYIFLNYFQSFTSSNDTSSLLPRPKYETRQRASLTRIGQSLTPLSLTLRNWIHEINSSAAENMHIYTAREGRAVSNLITILFPHELYAAANKERQRERERKRESTIFPRTKNF